MSKSSLPVPETKGPDPKFVAELRKELRGEVLDDTFSRARYAVDASFYRIEPIAVVLPRTTEDIRRAVEVARARGVPVLPRGAGTSQGGQTVGRALVVDTSKYLTQLLDVDEQAGSAVVEPGIVLDRLNDQLASRGLFFAVDPATSSRATLGGMAGNNSAGARSIRYGMMVDNVKAIDALLSDGQRVRFESITDGSAGAARLQGLVDRLRALRQREAEEIEKRVPKLLRHVAGYNLHRVRPGRFNMADLLVGSEGTLGFFTKLELLLHRVPVHRVLGVCHFPSFKAAMQATPVIVELQPTAVELIDRTLLEMAQGSPVFGKTLSRFVMGHPNSLLLVEFSGDEEAPLVQALERLDEEMRALGHRDAVLRVLGPDFQRDIWNLRKSGMNIVTSMKGDGKPVAFIEDCAVPLEHLAEYTARVEELFAKHGTKAVWYAHASVGCLHVRPILNLKQRSEVGKMRDIAEAAHELIREFKGSHSGEHGDGLVRSEFLEPMLGERLVRAFGEIKHAFDPVGLFNPGKIVSPPKMDDPRLLRFRKDAQPLAHDAVLDWSEWGGLLQATEMCNNNGACRKAQPDVMCPSYRVTGDEQHVTRGRANTLRDALLGRLGPDALQAPEMLEAMELCVSCKACRRECPAGVDMARMKIEVLHRAQRAHGPSRRDRAIAYLPRYAPWAARFPRLVNLAGIAPARWAAERWLGLSAKRRLPRFRRDFLRASGSASARGSRRVAILPDTFTTYFEPENGHAARRVLEAGGYSVELAGPKDGGRPPCCGRTFLAVGMVEEARRELVRSLQILEPWISAGVPIVGIEPSCLLTLRDEGPALVRGGPMQRLAESAVLFEELLSREAEAGRLELPLGALPIREARLHGHCHQKAFGLMPAVERTLRLVPGLEVETIQSSCCGMAGAFGYDARHYDTSMKMGELTLLPAVRGAGEDTWLVADGTSCRQQIRDGAGRDARHVARVLEAALDAGR